MSKPIVRWTFGGCLQEQAYEILHTSIRNFTQIYKNRFSYYLMYNNCDEHRIKKIANKFKITPLKQSWDDCPIPHNYATVTAGKSGKFFGGSMWKWCPARLNCHLHEILIDNDVVLMKPLRQIDEFLESNSTMITADPVKFFGRYKHLFKDDEKYNAGFLGIPPYFDFYTLVREIWKQNGSFDNLTQADEQGITAATLKQCPQMIVIPGDTIIEIHSHGIPINSIWNEASETNKIEFLSTNYTLDHFAYHFVGANRNNHEHWEKFSNQDRKFPSKFIL